MPAWHLREPSLCHRGVAAALMVTGVPSEAVGSPPPTISHGSQASGSVLRGDGGLFPSWGRGGKHNSLARDDLDAQVHVLGVTTRPRPLPPPVGLDGASCLLASPVPVPGLAHPGMGLEQDAVPLSPDMLPVPVGTAPPING